MRNSALIATFGRSSVPVLLRQYILKLVRQLNCTHVRVEHFFHIELNELFERFYDFILAIVLHQALKIAQLHTSLLKRLVHSLVQNVTICPIE